MNAVVGGLLIFVGAILGFVVGNRCKRSNIFGRIVRFAIAQSCGLVVVYATWQQHWTWPIGLISPLLYGLIGSVLVACLSDKWSRVRNARSKRIVTPSRQLNGFAGAGIGVAVSLVFCPLLLRVESQPSRARTTNPTPASAPLEPRTALGEFARIVNVGFVRHVPIAGDMSAELVAIASILDQPLETRKQFAIAKRWDSLAELPSFVAIVENKELIADIDAAADGSLLALYRLQKHPLVLEFAREEELQSIVSQFDAQEIAKELEHYNRRSR